ncbi:transcription antitermination regulator [Mycolicibacterium sp. GF69]|uniref:ANTAR domain-containing protein n=1 Tax=Mycolicibacterium sp. GF69 TaxID=2267251 RepID=UPI000DCCB551|nr:ANTAR domain-containing protein [Mycolicibacterium sp. GF69]RAV18293.1 transcription antitermination regulator [Mycolicibacterium sp. GF69]
MTPGRKCLDTAEGVLVALRHCTVDEAFREIIRAAQHHQVPLFTLADALVTAASGTVASGTAEYPNVAARTAVLAEWGPLLLTPTSAHQ